MIEEKKTINNTDKPGTEIVPEKTFNVTIEGLENQKFTFTGPIRSSIEEREGAVYRLLSEYIIVKWREALIKAGKERKEKDASVKDTDVKDAGVKHTSVKK